MESPDLLTAGTCQNMLCSDDMYEISVEIHTPHEKCSCGSELVPDGVDD